MEHQKHTPHRRVSKEMCIDVKMEKSVRKVSLHYFGATQLNWQNSLPTNCPAYNISPRDAHKTQFLCCCLQAVV
jgi:hypothetical protein